MTDITSNDPILMFVRGMPGSGKSYLAAELQKRLGSERVVMLDPDAADYESAAYKELSKVLSAEGVDPKVYPYRYLRAQAYEGIRAGKVILWNQPFTNQGMFDRLAENLQGYAAERRIRLPMLVVEVEVDPAIAKERVMRRKHEGGHGPSESTLERRIGEYRSYADNGYAVVSVDGQGDLSESVSTVLQALRNLQK